MKGINKRKRIRSQPLKQSAGKSIAEALLEVGNRATALSGQDKSERAVEVVLEEYETVTPQHLWVDIWIPTGWEKPEARHMP